MSKCIDNRITEENRFDNDDNCIYTNLENSSVKSKVLLPLKVNKILDCAILTEEQNRFLGKIRFDISCSSGLLEKAAGGNISIESIGVNYNDIVVIAPRIIMTVNGNEVILSKTNEMNNKYEGKINTFSKCCSDENRFMKKLITISGIETFMKNGVITVKGNICGIDFCAQAIYDGYLNGDNCTYTIVNNARLLQSGVVIATSANTQTVIGNLGILNKYNANSFYGYLCLQDCCSNGCNDCCNNCCSNWITAYFDNEFCINCIIPAECYDGSGTFEAYIYGTYKSSLNLYSISKEGAAVYTVES